MFDDRGERDAEGVELGQQGRHLRLAAVGLDVFPQEPPDSSHPIFRHERSIFTPHLIANSALAEILNMVGGRVQHGLNANGLQAQIGLPIAIPPTEPKGESIMLGFGFESMEGEPQTFSFTIREQDASKGAKTQ